ncbi:cytochrome P450 [Xylariales sp. AK1849]|nr:cytochrome P450 [Xylariales sp. AK1849]
MSFALTNVALIVVFGWLLWKVILGLWLGPLSKVPGPKFAAVTYLDEFYHQAIRNDWGTYLKSLHHNYGPLVRIGPNEVSILDHEFNYVHFNKRDLDKEERYFQLAPRSTATITPHTEHKIRRDIILPLFNGKHLREFEMVSLSPYLTKLDNHLCELARSGESLNLTHLIWAACNDILVKYIFDSELGLLDQGNLAAGYKLRSFNATRLASVFRQWPLVLLFKIRNLPIIQSVTALPIESLVRKLTTPLFSRGEAGSESKARGGVAQALQTNKMYQNSLVLNPECAEFMLGGTEALTYDLIHVFHGLMSDPEVVTKLRKELDDLQKGDGHIWEDPRVPSLPYLNAVVREGLRLNDSEGISFVRQSKETVIYNGFSLPPYTTISMSEMLINWDPSVFPEAARFQPSRWLGDDPVIERAKKLSVGFGVGNRTCVAKDLSLSVMTRIVAAIVAKFDIEFWTEAEKDGWGVGYLRLFPPASVTGPMVASKFTPDITCLYNPSSTSIGPGQNPLSTFKTTFPLAYLPSAFSQARAKSSNSTTLSTIGRHLPASIYSVMTSRFLARLFTINHKLRTPIFPSRLLGRLSSGTGQILINIPPSRTALQQRANVSPPTQSITMSNSRAVGSSEAQETRDRSV